MYRLASPAAQKVCWYDHTTKDDTQVIDARSRLADELPTGGFEVYYKRLRREGHKWNRKHVLRVYRAMNLKLSEKKAQKTIARKDLDKVDIPD